MFGELEPQLLVNTLIQQNLHLAKCALDSGEAEFFTLLQNLDSNRPADRREPFQKFIERFAVLDVVKTTIARGHEYREKPGPHASLRDRALLLPA